MLFRLPFDRLRMNGSMVRVDHFVCSFSALRGKTAHNSNVKYRALNMTMHRLCNSQLLTRKKVLARQ
jgi:hypothetical protein